MSRIREELERQGYGGAVDILIGEGFSEADAVAGVLGAVPRTVEEQIRATAAADDECTDEKCPVWH